jgi:hypothetical protein
MTFPTFKKVAIFFLILAGLSFFTLLTHNIIFKQRDLQKIIHSIALITTISSIFSLIILQFLYPQHSREFQKPYAKAKGGVISDTISGIDANVLQDKLGNKPTTAIKIRCQHCQALNEETDKFCSNCGKPL